MRKRLYLYLAIMLLGVPVNAEVYRWTDQEGNVHYTDKKSADNAEDVTRKVSKQNIDTSTDELHKVEGILRKENDADREFAQQQLSEGAEERAYLCKRAKARLDDITGRVIFVDDNGKVVKVTEKERQQMVDEQQEIINTNCDN